LPRGGRKIFQFGIGALYINPVGGNLASNPTPYQMLTIQDVSVDIGQDLKELVGQYRFADDVAPGQMKITGKFTVGRIDIGMFNQLFFASTEIIGVKNIVSDEVHSIPAVTPFTVTVTNSITFTTDLGVRYSSNGVALIRVASSPTTGQYSVSAGVYTFAAADTGLGILISYVATVSASGNTVQINQQLLGYGPVFELWLAESYQAVAGVNNGIHLFTCRASKLNRDLKNIDYEKPEIDFSAFANAAGQVAEFFQVAP